MTIVCVCVCVSFWIFFLFGKFTHTHTVIIQYCRFLDISNWNWIKIRKHLPHVCVCVFGINKSFKPFVHLLYDYGDGSWLISRWNFVLLMAEKKLLAHIFLERPHDSMVFFSRRGGKGNPWNNQLAHIHTHTQHVCPYKLFTISIMVI